MPNLEEIARLAELARLDLDETELAAYAEQLGRILEHVRRLEELDARADAMMHATPADNVFRPDEPAPSLERDLALESAPDRHDGQLRVPRTV